MAKALITGVNGFVGKYLARLLQSLDYEVLGIDQSTQCAVGSVRYTQASILDSAGLAKIVGTIRPDEIYHLAAISYPPDADSSPGFALQTNILGTVSLLDAVRTVHVRARTLLIGSSKEYDDKTVSDSISEDVQANPRSFYGISKYAGELIGLQYVQQFELDIRFTRSFNHTGPGQPPSFVCSDWARQVAEIVLEKAAPVMNVGDLEAQIDFSDVRDVVAAYQAILARGVAGEIYNVCSAKGTPLRYILDYLIAKSETKIEVLTAEQKLRAHTTSPRLVGSNDKLVGETGWSSKIPLEKTLDELFEYWLEELKKPAAQETPAS